MRRARGLLERRSFALTIPAPADSLRVGRLRGTIEAFHREHDRAYGFSAPEEPTELVTVRVAAVGRMPRPRLRPAPTTTAGTGPERARAVYFEEARAFVQCAVYDRYALIAGQQLDGPSIIEELDSTCVLHPGYTATVDEFGNLLLAQARAAA